MHVLDGAPEQIAERLRRFRAAGLDHLVAHVGDNTRDAILADMRRFAEEVRPALA